LIGAASTRACHSGKLSRFACDVSTGLRGPQKGFATGVCYMRAMAHWNAERVRERIVEAAEIESRMRGPRAPSAPHTAWPVHKREAEDVAGWYRGEDGDEIQLAVTGAEMTAHDTVTGWLREYVANDSDRECDA
jgi:hypothetical protein